jgi:hypothetical protein
MSVSMRIPLLFRGSNGPLLTIAIVASGVFQCPAQQPASTPPPVDNSVVEAAAAATKQVVQDLGKADGLVGDAAKAVAAIKQITSPLVKPGSTNLDDIRNLQTIVAAIQHTSLATSLTDAKKPLDPTSTSSDEGVRKAKCQALPQDTSSSPDAAAAAAACAKTEKDAAAKLADLDKAATALTAALATIAPYVKDQVKAEQGKLAVLTKLTTIAAPDSDKILQTLPKGLPVLKVVITNRAAYQSSWDAMKAALGSAPDTDTAFADCKTAADGIVSKLKDWFPAILDSVQAATKDLNGKIPDVQSDPAKNSADALGAVRKQSDRIASVQSVIDAWQPLVGFLTNGDPDGFDLGVVKADVEDLQKWTNTLRSAVSRVQDALSGNSEDFDADQVSLYYFTDIPRLMYALNENVQQIGGVADAQAKAADQRAILLKAELDLAEEQASVNRYQRDTLDLQEQQRQTNLQLQDLLNKNAKAGTKPPSAADQASQDQTQKKADDLQKQSDSVAAKLAAAQQSLSDAQTAVAKDRGNMIVAAQAESDAFAFARDNTPFLLARADASSSDPAKRVMLYAFNDSKRIFMRGKPRDLALVKHIISVFDQPAPQARLTLWSFELDADSSGKTNERAAKLLNQSMEIVDEELSRTRALENTTISLLREIINQQVRIHFEGTPPPRSACPKCEDSDFDKLQRINFYAPQVLHQLGFDTTSVDLIKLRALVPDPAGTTTLGEALMILSLAPLKTRRDVRDEFEGQVRASFGRLPLPPETKERLNPKGEGPPPELLPLMWHSLGIWEGGTASGNGLNSSQLEITRALRTAYEGKRLSLLLDKLMAFYGDLAQIGEQMKALAAQEKENRSEADKHDAAVRKNALEARVGTIHLQSVPLLNRLGSLGVDVGDLVSRFGAALAIGDFGKALLSLSGLTTRAIDSSTLSSPRVAAADEMLKEIIIALEDDLDRLFIRPMITNLRIRLTTAKVRVGILQRESLLASNRGKARVDPKASAQLAVGEEEDILGGVQQLAQLFSTGMSGGALGALGSLQKMPKEKPPEIYALTTGNKFEVTPIFDPSGQALRFKFDFVSTSNLREPNGTTNPQFPRIERHTVNTEVQLSNLETREISRFESNARLGLPTTYSGGFPILKDIPGVRPWVPLVGWFVRKAGSNASAQQSVIFGQTTMYPTIGAIIDLLSDSGGAEKDDGGQK